jgi:glycosyltransferase involved in cell wall biosynthesis
VRRRLRAEAPRRAAVLWIEDASDRELSALYRGARFTVLPSFEEGWGLPVQESLAHGTPCIASAAGGIPEAGLDLAEYVRADSAAELARAIEKYATDDGALLRARDEIARRLQRSTRPSWRDSAETLAALLGLSLA